MTANITKPLLAGSKEVLSVVDFAKRHRLGNDEEVRLLKLLGHFARKHELLMNVRREARFR